VNIRKIFGHKAETAKGRTKKVTGRVTGNRRLTAKGRAGQATGSIRQAGDKVRSAFKH
jgi:uncharacterized protein YjbJ (UPF0337 family)